MNDSAPTMRAMEIKPTPDPTVLTTEQLLREIERVVKLLEAEMKAIHVEIDGNRRYYEERFQSISHEFDLVESRRVEQKTDTKVAVDAAFSAQKDAVREQTAASEKAIAKSESSTKEQATQQYATITAELKAIRDTVADVKNRVVTIEAIKLGQTEVKTTQRLDLGSLLGVISIIIVVLSIFASFIVRMP